MLNKSPYQSLTRDELIDLVQKLHAEKSGVEHALRERIKELQAIYRLSELSTRKQLSFSDMFTEVLPIIVSGLQYPELACVRIQFGGEVYQSADFKITDWKLSEKFQVEDCPDGLIEVCYLERTPTSDGDSFLAEERYLLSAIADKLSVMTGRKLMDEEFRTIFNESPVAICLIDMDKGYRFVNMNQTFLKLTGYRKNELIGQRIVQTGLINDMQVLQNILTGIEQDRTVRNLQFNYLDRNQQVKTTLLCGRLINYGGRNILIASFEEQTEMLQLKKAEENINEFNRVLVKALPFGIEIIDEKGCILFANERLKKQFGDNLVGSYCWMSYRNDEKPCLGCPLNHEIEVGKTYVVDSEGVMDDRILQVSYTGFLYQGKKSLLKLYVDITEKTLAERELRETREKLQGIFDSLDDAYFQIDMEGRIGYLNPAAPVLFGYTSVDEMIGMPISRLWADESELRLSKQTIDEQDVLRDSTIQAIRQDGSLFWVSLSAKFLYDEQGKLKSRQGLVRDISRRKETEQLLHQAKVQAEENERKLLEAQEIARLGSWDWELETDRIFWSDGIFKLLDASPGRAPKSYNDLLQFYTGNSRERLQQAVSRCLKNGKPYEIELDMLKNDGSTMAVVGRGRAIKDSSGKITGLQGTLLDVDKQKKLEKELIASKEKAEESDRLKTAFLMNLSHEIRTPMNGIVGFLNLLSEPGLEEHERNEFLDIVSKSSERLMNTINDIVEISKIEIGDLHLNFEEIDTTQLLRFHFDSFATQVHEKGIELKLDTQIPVNSNLIFSDKHKLNVILMNLIKNAIKFTPHGKIELGNYIENHRLYLLVRDTGIGIAEDQFESIFKRFVQAEAGSTRDFEGSGIGLSIVKGFVEALNGQIELRSKPGEGSTFMVSFPLPPKTRSLALPVTAMPETLQTILVLEDDPVNQFFIKTLLEKSFRLLFAETGFQTMQLFGQHPEIDLVLLDIKVPGEDSGLDVTRKIRAINPAIPIVAQTAYASETDKLAALEAGCTDYISKPYLKAELYAVIAKYL